MPRWTLIHWAVQHPLRGLAIFLALSALALNSLFLVVAPPGYDDTVLRHAWNTLRLRNIYTDSWGIMSDALDYLLKEQSTEHPTPVYTEVFFTRGRKLQYLLSSLLPFHLVRGHLDGVLAVFLAGMIGALAVLFEVRWRQCRMPNPTRWGFAARAALVTAAREHQIARALRGDRAPTRSPPRPQRPRSPGNSSAAPSFGNVCCEWAKFLGDRPL
jgi:hypothetical protein